MQSTATNGGKSNLVQVEVTKGCIDFTISNTNVPGLVDSGAFASCMSPKFISRHANDQVLSVKNCFVKVFVADGGMQVARKRAKVKFHVKGVEFVHDFLVVPSLARPVILGTDFLRASKALLDFGDHFKTMHLPIRAVKNMMLPPEHESLLVSEVTSYLDLTNTCGLTQNLMRNNDVPYALKRTLNSPYGLNNNMIVAIFNAKKTPVKIYKGEILGVYTISETQFFDPFDVGSNKSPHPEALSTSINDLRVEARNIAPDLADLVKGAASEKDGEIKVILNEDQEARLESVIQKYICLFGTKEEHVGGNAKYEVKIELKHPHTPINKGPYRLAPHKREILNKILQEQVAAKIIEECTEPGEWSSPIFLVEKPGSTPESRKYRIVQDFRHLNESVVDMASPYPRADDILELVGNAKPIIFSKFDALSVFYQISIEPSCRKYTAFSTHDTRYQYRCLPQGLRTSPRAFQTFM